MSRNLQAAGPLIEGPAGLKADLDVHRPNVDQLVAVIGDGDDGDESTFSAVNAKIAIVTCASSRKMENILMDKMPLVELMMPSLLNTTESDRFQYKLYVGIDTNDEFWMDPLHQRHVRNLALETSEVAVVFVEVEPKEGIQRIPFNEVCRKAYDDGAEYIVRINDDTEFVTKYWTSVGVAALLSFSPPNLGVVGPTCDQGATRIMTHDMTHRTHMGVFSLDYYPPDFGNMYVDDWMSHVYGPSRTAKLDNWHVYHHAKISRYRNDNKAKQLGENLRKGKNTLAMWLETDLK